MESHHLPKEPSVWARALSRLEECITPIRRQDRTHHEHAVNQTKCQVIGTDAVPHSNERHIDKDADGKSPQAGFSEGHSQRQEEIVSQPAGQTHMPPAPELLDIDCSERTIEVGRPLDSKKHAYA